MKRLVTSFFFLFMYFNLSAQDVELIRWIDGVDTVRIYTKDVIWVTKYHIKFTEEASNKLKGVKCPNPNVKMFYRANKKIFRRVYRVELGKGYPGSFTFVFFTKDGKYIEENNVYRCTAHNIFNNANKYKIPKGDLNTKCE